MLREQDSGVNTRGIAWISAATRDPRDTRETWHTDPGARRSADTGRIFDAVVLRADVGSAVLEALTVAGQPVGAVIAEHHTGTWAWLVGPGSRDAWANAVGPSGGVRYHYIGGGNRLTIPGPQPDPGASMTWAVRPGLGIDLTCVPTLAAAFLAAERGFGVEVPCHGNAGWHCPQCEQGSAH